MNVDQVGPLLSGIQLRRSGWDSNSIEGVGQRHAAADMPHRPRSRMTARLFHATANAAFFEVVGINRGLMVQGLLSP